MQMEVDFFDLRTVFCNFNCSLACVRNTVSGVSLGFCTAQVLAGLGGT